MVKKNDEELVATQRVVAVAFVVVAVGAVGKNYCGGDGEADELIVPPGANTKLHHWG